jgi:hypothetical protein
MRRPAPGQGPQNFLLFAPPPVERHVKLGFANCWQNVVGSVVPALAGMFAESQLRKQYVCGADWSGAQISLKPEGHSPGTAQQSASLWQACEQ